MGQQFDTTSALVGDDLCQHRIATIHTMETRHPAGWVRLPGTHHTHIPAGPLADVLPATFDTNSSTWHLTNNCPDLHTPATSSSPTPNPAERSPADDCTRCLQTTTAADTTVGRWLLGFIHGHQLVQMAASTWNHLQTHTPTSLRHHRRLQATAAAELRCAHWIRHQADQLLSRTAPDVRQPLDSWLAPLVDAAQTSIDILHGVVDATFEYIGNGRFHQTQLRPLRTIRRLWRRLHRPVRRPDVLLVLLDRQPQPADLTTACRQPTSTRHTGKKSMFERHLHGTDNYLNIVGRVVSQTELVRRSHTTHTTDDLHGTALLADRRLLGDDLTHPTSSLPLTGPQLAALLNDRSDLSQPDSWTFDRPTIDTICKTYDRSYRPDRGHPAQQLTDHLTAVATALTPPQPAAHTT